MSSVTTASITNRLIDGLPRRDRNHVLSLCEPVGLEFGASLCEPEQPFRDVYFPLNGFVSLLAPTRSPQPLELGLIGNEGMLGATLALGIDTVPSCALVRGSGGALRMSAPQLRRLLRESPALLRTLNRYLYVLMAQLSQTAACNRFHEAEARLARWLLMTHDRAHADCFHLTHKLLADMLGLRRSSVTIAAGNLQQRGLVRYTRGEINILDREGLEAVSCDCYASLIADYRNNFA